MISGIGMRPIEAVLVLGAFALVLARCLPPRFRRRVAIGAATVSLASAAVLVVVGLRWQMVPVLVAVVGVLPFTARTMLGKPGDRRIRWWLAGPGSAAGVLAIVAGVGAAIAFPIPDFPTPPASTRSARPSSSGPIPIAPRRGRPIPTMCVRCRPRFGTGPGEPWSRWSGRSTSAARRPRRRSSPEPSRSISGFPVHPRRPRASPHQRGARRAGRLRQRAVPGGAVHAGYGAGRWTNTAWAEELASHGYVVAALDHPYDSTAVVFADGRTVRRPAFPISSDAEGYRLGEAMAAVKASDLSSALTHLGRLDSGEVESTLAGRLATDRAAVVGMSAGVGGAFQAARTDERFSAVVALDGYPYDADPGPYDQPALALTQQIGLEDNPNYLPALERMLEMRLTERVWAAVHPCNATWSGCRLTTGAGATVG